MTEYVRRMMIGRFFAPALGYADALWVLFDDGSYQPWATGPHMDEGLASTAAVPMVDAPHFIAGAGW